MEVIIPWLMAELIDKGIDGGNMNFILKLGIMLAIVCVVSLIFGALSGKYSASASSGFAKNLRKDMFYNIQNFSFSNNISRSARSNRGRTISAAVLESPIRFIPYRQRPSFTKSRWTIPIFYFGIGLSIIPRICSSCVYALMIVPLSPN